MLKIVMMIIFDNLLIKIIFSCLDKCCDVIATSPIDACCKASIWVIITPQLVKFF